MSTSKMPMSKNNKFVEAGKKQLWVLIFARNIMNSKCMTWETCDRSCYLQCFLLNNWV